LQKKLADENFLTRAPEDAVNEARVKLSQTEERLRILRRILGDLS